MALKVFREGQEVENESRRTEMSAVLIHAVAHAISLCRHCAWPPRALPALITPDQAQGARLKSEFHFRFLLLIY